MNERNCKIRFRRALTLLELVLAMVMITIVFAAVVPQFAAIRHNWDSKQGSAEALQNGRVLIDHINRNLSKAKIITAVSDSSVTSGYIQFQDYNGITYRYDIAAGNSYVEYGVVGSLSDLAGPVSSLKFTCYDACNISTPLSPVTDVNVIRIVQVDVIFTNSASGGQNKTFTTKAYLRINGNINDEIRGCWKLDETSGSTATDSSISGNNGTLYNMESTDWGAGQLGNALTFDGVNEYVSLPIGSVIGSLTNGTISSWVKWSGLGNVWQRVWDFGIGTTSYMFLTINNGATSTPRFAITNSGYGGENLITAPLSLDSNVWHHMAVTIDSNNHTDKLYIDGTLVAQNTSAYLKLSDIGTTTNNYLGRSNYSADPYFNGSIDEVRIYNRVLSATEIADLANVLTYRDLSKTKAGSDVTSISVSSPSDTNTGDLLIAAVATDGGTTISTPSGWILINQVSDASNQVTLGAWWKNATAAGATSSTFTWSGSQQAYGWIMRFTGHNSTYPINTSSATSDSSSTPTSPAVTTTAANCMILRLGAFDDNNITVDSPGLSGHTAITMDSSVGIFDQDIGSVSAAGSASYSGGTWTVKGSGVDIWDNADEFHYVYESLNGDGTIYARVVSIGNTNIWAKAGVMIRETLTANSKHAIMVVTPSCGNSFQRRTSTGGTSTLTAGSAVTAPYWVKLTRVGNTLTGYESSNGSAWTQVGTDTVTMATSVYIGLCVTSHNDGTICTATFDNVTGLSVSGGTVSGGAGYVKQSPAGSSGTSAFSLKSSNEASMLTIAIAPADTNMRGCCGQLTP